MSLHEAPRSRPLSRLGWPLVIGLSLGGCQPTAPADTKAPVNACNLNHQRCSAPTRWGELSIELSPRPLPVLQPIALDARLAGAAAISASLEGVEMEMGPNVVALQRVDAQTLRGQLSIPICLTGRMKWRLALRIKDAQATQTVDFMFEAPLAPTTEAAARHPG